MSEEHREPEDQKSGMTFNVSQDGMEGMPDELRDAQIGPLVAISAIALNMAMKYADINTVQDGLLYQQYKLEGRNMQSLHLSYVFDIAIQIEEHLVKSNKRVAKMIVVSVLEEKLADATEDDEVVVESEESAEEETKSPPDPPTTPSAAT